MSIDPLAASSAAAQPGKAQSSLSKLGADYQNFLKLLTAQVSNQDPLAPMDSTTFVTQLAQLSQVEQSVQQNTNLEAISAQLSSLGALSGMALIGRTVVAPSSQGALGAEGPMSVPYRLGSEASAVTLTIRDEAGEILRVLKDLPGAAGSMHDVAWDGRDMNGNRLPAGRYRIELEALDLAGEPVNTQTFARAQVDSMSFEQGMATLHLANGDSVLAGMVERVE